MEGWGECGGESEERGEKRPLYFVWRLDEDVQENSFFVLRTKI